MSTIVKARCYRCQAIVNAESMNYLGYIFAHKYESMGCITQILHLLMLLLTGGFWVGWMAGLGFLYGTRYFCVSCKQRLSESDIVL
jgi:hypothetical protein